MNSKRSWLQIFFLFCSVIVSLFYTRPTFIVFAEMGSADGSNKYNLELFGKSYPINYQITGFGNRVSNISAEADNATLLINILAQSNGRLSIDLPRNIIDSKKQGNVDDPYVVFEDGQATNPQEIGTNSQARTLAIDFDKGTGQIEIAGSKLLPEFGPSSALILAAAIAATVALSRKTT